MYNEYTAFEPFRIAAISGSDTAGLHGTDTRSASRTIRISCFLTVEKIVICMECCI